MSAPARRTPWICSALAAAAYLLVALLTFRAILPAPATTLPYPAMLDNAKLPRTSLALLDHWDQAMVVSTVIRNAHLATTRPWDLLGDEGQCFPLKRPYTLGEHMLGTGLLAALPYLATGDPILTYNVLLVLTIWIPGLTMYFFSLRFTQSAAAAFLAGLAFALVPARIVDPSHPYVHGDLWAPGALLFLHRVFTNGRWWDALGLAFFLGLVATESLYPLLSTSILAGAYGLYLLVKHRSALGRVAPKLILALGVVGLVLWLVLGPYLETRDTWGLLEGRHSILLKPIEYAPGQSQFAGWVVGTLALIGLLDRLRGTRLTYGEDPRLALLVGGLLVAWCTIGSLWVPIWNHSLPSPLSMLRQVVPGLAAVRALSAVAIGVSLVTAFLAGYGMLVLTERIRSHRAVIAVVAIACLAMMAFRFYSPLARMAFGRTLRLTAYHARPAEADVALVRRIPSGPQVDLPLSHAGAGGKRLDVAAYLLLSSFAPRSLAACYNSFLSPVNTHVTELASRLPDAGAADALAALGFENVLFHKKHLPEVQRDEFLARYDADPERQARLARVDETERTVAYRLARPSSVTEDLSALATHRIERASIDLLPPRGVIPFHLTNQSADTYRHAQPVAPEDLVVLWFKDGRLVRRDTSRALLPVALGPGETMSIDVEVPVPEEAGVYDVALVRASEPERWLSAREVRTVALDAAVSPVEALVRRSWDFISTSVLPRGLAAASPPQATLDMVISSDLSGEDVVAANDLVVRWISSTRELVGETSVAATPTLAESDDRIVQVPVAVPPIKGAHLAVLAPSNRRDHVLAARLVTVSPANGTTDDTQKEEAR